MGEQDAKAQVAALTAAGCEKIYDNWQRRTQGPASAVTHDRAVARRRCRDVWKLDGLSRNIKDFASFIVRLEKPGVGFRSLTESIDTTSAAGRIFAHIVAAFAEYEREIIRSGPGHDLRLRAECETPWRSGF